MLFLSDTVIANDLQIQLLHLLPQMEEHTALKYTFLHEEIMASGWVWWTCFWTRFTHTGLYLMDPLGR